MKMGVSLFTDSIFGPVQFAGIFMLATTKLAVSRTAARVATRYATAAGVAALPRSRGYASTADEGERMGLSIQLSEDQTALKDLARRFAAEEMCVVVVDVET